MAALDSVSETKEYLVLFYHFDNHGYVDFRLEEFESLCSLYSHCNPFPNGYDKNNNLHNPFIKAQLPINEEIAIKICNRSMLTKAIYDVLVEGESMNDLLAKLNNLNVSKILKKYKSKSHRIRNVYFGKKCSQKEQVSNIKLLEKPFLSFLDGNVLLNNAEIEYHFVADYGDYTHLGYGKAREHPLRVYLCRYIAGSSRDLVRKFSLKNRKYVGSTSLDSELSFLMANQAKIDNGSIMLDPFCGTGSLLISSTYFGGICFGADIDIRVLRGNKYFDHGIKKSDDRYSHKSLLKEEEEIIKNTEDHSIYANFRQYGLNKPELVRCDLSNLCWHNFDAMKLCFDAILCDPPYGIRAGARKSGTKNPIKIPKEYEHNHHPRTQIYEQTDIMYDLLQFVAKYLKFGGRFVYLLPATIYFDQNKDLPKHPCLRLIGNSEQKCQGKFCRRLITMEKYKEFNENMVPFIPPKADFAELKNKIFYSHIDGNNEKGKNKKKKKEKRKKSPILSDVVNPNDLKKQKCINMNDISN